MDAREPARYLVTGGTGGIGAAVCADVAARGCTPLVGYHRQAEVALALAKQLGGEAVRIDMTDASSISAACTTMAAHPAGLAGVVLAASPPPTLGPFGTISASDMTRQWAVNVLGPQQLLAELVRLCFRPRKRGSVVGVLTSAMGQGIGTAAGNMGAYLIAKHGLAGVLAAAAADYPWLHVRAVSPSFTETPMLDAFDARYLDLQRARQPFDTPAQVAAQIVAQLIAPPVAPPVG